MTSTTITTPEYSAPAIASTFAPPRRNDVPDGTTLKNKWIDGGDWGPYNATWRDGKLYTAHTIDLDGDLEDPVSRAVRWYEFDLGDWPIGSSTPSLSQYGQIDAGTTGVNTISTFFPAIAPNRCGQTAMVMAASSVDLFASIMVTGRDATDPYDTMLFPEFLHVGSIGYETVRWGDYFMVTPDPSYGGAFWAIGMFTVATSDTATKIGKFTIGPDTDSNGIPDACQDCNNNGVDDALDLYASTSLDCNVNGFPDECETAELMGDCNTNGVPDRCEILGYDCDTNGIDDSCAYDCNSNGYPDACDIAAGTSTDCNNDGAADDCGGDCNSNGSWDDCDIFAGTSLDCNANHVPDECEDECNGNNIPDECELAAGTALDCNTNGVPDDCDVAGATSVDCNSNAAPDECEVDCNTNGIADDCDIAEGTSQDCGTNGIPDECGADCNTNSIIDECEIEAGTSEDCNVNGVPDACDLAEGGLAVDCDMDGELDECSVLRGASPDCNTNGVPDECDIAIDPEIDCNTNGIVDLCDIAAGTSPDVDSNGRPDDCPCKASDVNCDGSTNSGDLGIIQLPLNWSKSCEDATHPRADVNQDGNVNAGDLGIVQSPLNWNIQTGPCDCVPNQCASTESMISGGGVSAMSFESGLGPSQLMASSCSFAPADLAIEIQPVGGGSAVTVLSPDTTYELHYDAETEHVTTYVLEVVAQTSAQGLTTIAAPSSGDWSDTGRFAFTDVQSTYGDLITAPGFESGDYRTDWATDTYFPGEQTAAPTGHLCDITTQSAGPFTLVVYLMDEDAESCQYVLMQTVLTLTVTGE